MRIVLLCAFICICTPLTLSDIYHSYLNETLAHNISKSVLNYNNEWTVTTYIVSIWIDN